MGDENAADLPSSTVVDSVVAHAHAVAGPRGEELASFVQAYYAHVAGSDLEQRRIEDLFGLAADHSAKASS